MKHEEQTVNESGTQRSFAWWNAGNCVVLHCALCLFAQVLLICCGLEDQALALFAQEGCEGLAPLLSLFCCSEAESSMSVIGSHVIWSPREKGKCSRFCQIWLCTSIEICLGNEMADNFVCLCDQIFGWCLGAIVKFVD